MKRKATAPGGEGGEGKKKSKKKEAFPWPVVPGESRDALLSLLKQRVAGNLRQGGHQTPPEEGRRESKHKRVSVPWAPGQGRQRLLIGVNEATRVLERERLDLLLVCRDARPVALVEHLPAMARGNETPCLVLPQASELLGKALGLQRCLVLGIRSADDPDKSNSSDGKSAPADLGHDRDRAFDRAIDEFTTRALKLPRGAL